VSIRLSGLRLSNSTTSRDVRTAARKATTADQNAGTRTDSHSEGPSVHAHSAMTVDGVRRTYRSIVPAQPTGGLPLLIVLYGRGQAEPAVLSQTGFFALVQQRQAVLVLPDGEQRSWNAGHSCCGFAGFHQASDVPFVAAIVTDAVRRWPIDAARVYLVGYSNGGKLAYSTMCAHPALFAAVATYGAVPLAPCQPGTAAVSSLLAAGTADQVLPFHGKPGGHPPLPAVPQAVAWLRAQDGCSGTVLTGWDGSAMVQRWVSCAAGTDVESVIYPGLGHAWPARTSGGSSPAAALMWAFLSRHEAKELRTAASNVTPEGLRGVADPVHGGFFGLQLAGHQPGLRQSLVIMAGWCGDTLRLAFSRRGW
jgi:polyhydroxybutyrate depolymerase